jgi:hypothetical protein
VKEEMEDAVVEDFHDCEFQDAAEGYVDDDDLESGRGGSSPSSHSGCEPSGKQLSL